MSEPIRVPGISPAGSLPIESEDLAIAMRMSNAIFSLQTGPSVESIGIHLLHVLQHGLPRVDVTSQPRLFTPTSDFAPDPAGGAAFAARVRHTSAIGRPRLDRRSGRSHFPLIIAKY